MQPSDPSTSLASGGNTPLKEGDLVLFVPCTPARCGGCMKVTKVSPGREYKVIQSHNTVTGNGWVRLRNNTGAINYYSSRHFILSAGKAQGVCRKCGETTFIGSNHNCVSADRKELAAYRKAMRELDLGLMDMLALENDSELHNAVGRHVAELRNVINRAYLHRHSKPTITPRKKEKGTSA